jgi:hypothetical protein
MHGLKQEIKGFVFGSLAKQTHVFNALKPEKADPNGRSV